MITTDTAVLLVARIPVGNLDSNRIPQHLAAAEQAMEVNHPNVELVLLTTRTSEADIWVIPLRELVEGSSDVKLTEEELAEFRKRLYDKLDQYDLKPAESAVQGRT